MNDFERIGLIGGIWSGLLRRATPPNRVLLAHFGAIAGQANLSEDEPGIWRVEAALPLDRISGGIQAFTLMADNGDNGDDLTPGAEILDQLTLMAGAPLDDNVFAELAVLRAELDLLKREMRRMAQG